MAKYFLILLSLLLLSGCIFNNAEDIIEPSFVTTALEMMGGAVDTVADSDGMSSLAMGSPPLAMLLVGWNMLRGHRKKKEHLKEKEHFKSKETGSSLFFHAIKEASSLEGAKSIADLGIKSQQDLT